MDNLKLEILEGSYWEHFKIAKDMALIWDLNNPRRKKIETELNKISLEINKIKNNGNKTI